MRSRTYLFPLAILSLTAILIGCGIQVRPESADVSIHFVDRNQALDGRLEGCTFAGEVVGSYGRWYTYLFISNPDLTQGALNDMKNKARELGADTVMVHQRLFFRTSVTFLGEAYRCRQDR